jgi:hypothetical protein
LAEENPASTISISALRVKKLLMLPWRGSFRRAHFARLARPSDWRIAAFGFSSTQRVDEKPIVQHRDRNLPSGSVTTGSIRINDRRSCDGHFVRDGNAEGEDYEAGVPLACLAMDTIGAVEHAAGHLLSKLGRERCL